MADKLISQFHNLGGRETGSNDGMLALLTAPASSTTIQGTAPRNADGTPYGPTLMTSALLAASVTAADLFVTNLNRQGVLMLATLTLGNLAYVRLGGSATTANAHYVLSAANPSWQVPFNYKGRVSIIFTAPTVGDQVAGAEFTTP